ncbi:MAG TPA: xanthine dehydrogenase family protein molybdopterin-binding subunit, partial [Dehalococcoidia bacterium]|nr:xanthine dehydrogenase family protein molybdopterin-binding subunit [Dehalococcoidia bacterium]
TGQAYYTGDVTLPRMLHAKVLRSPYPHARLVNVDAARARRPPGVREVLTPAGVGDVGMGPDQVLLPKERVLYLGEEVAAVAALDAEAAEEALDLIEVEYESLPPLLDFRLSKSAPALHRQAPDNVAYQIHMHHGDVVEGFAGSDLVREGLFTVEASHNCFLELHASVASYDATGKLTVWSPTQTPHFLRKDLAKALGLSEGDVRVIATNTGGAFSGRTGTLPHHYLAAVLSMRTGQPVRLACTRDEDFIVYRGGPALEVRVRVGCRRDGTLLALEVEAEADAGAYIARQRTYIYLGGAYCSFPYRIPNVKYDGYLLYTNNPPSGTHHGGGIVPVRYAVGLMLDGLARELGMDPVELRRRHALVPGEVTANKMRITSCGLEECIEKARARSGWRPGSGLGMECGGAASGGSDTSAAVVRVNDDGTVAVLVGLPDIGQGSNTAMAQIAAQELGVALERVRVISADTEITPMDLGAYAQRGTFVTGNAVKAAARQVKERLFEAAADLLEARPQDLEVEEDEVFVRGSPDRRLPFSKAVAAAQTSERGEPTMGLGHYTSPCERVDRRTWEGNISGAYSLHAQVAQVEVDQETGQAAPRRIVAAHDCGYAINPQSVEGQVEGQAWSGMSQALFERKVMDGGQVMNPSLLDYKMPTAVDSPPIETIIVESQDPNGPFGAKECGEGPITAAAPAMGNALQSVLGSPIRRMPMGPEEVLEAISRHASAVRSGVKVGP